MLRPRRTVPRSELRRGRQKRGTRNFVLFELMTLMAVVVAVVGTYLLAWRYPNSGTSDATQKVRVFCYGVLGSAIIQLAEAEKSRKNHAKSKKIRR